MKDLKKFFKKKKHAVVLVMAMAVVVAAGGLFWMQSNGYLVAVTSLFWHPGSSIKGIILFEGEDCPQCATVENFIAKNGVEAKVPFTRLEVFNNSDNARILSYKAQQCGLDYSQIGVPFLWDGQACSIGYVDIIKFFSAHLLKKE